MAETMIQTFNSLDLNAKRLYHKRDQNPGRLPSTQPYTDASHDTATATGSDWHRVLLGRLRPGATGKYQSGGRKDNKSQRYAISSSGLSNVTLQSYNDDSYTVDEQDISLTSSDRNHGILPLLNDSIRRESHYVKNLTPYRCADHITSLKRRVRKQQWKHFQDQIAVLQEEATLQMPSRMSIFPILHAEPARALRRYQAHKSSSIVALPFVTKPISTHV